MFFFFSYKGHDLQKKILDLKIDLIKLNIIIRYIDLFNVQTNGIISPDGLQIINNIKFINRNVICTIGEAIQVENGNIYVLKWRNKRDVFMVSTKHNLHFTSVIDKFERSKFKPTMVFDFNNNMSGIDRAEQMNSYYPTPRKCLRWYIKVFFPHYGHIMLMEC